MTTEIIPFGQKISELQPLGLPTGYKITLQSKRGANFTKVTMDLWDAHAWCISDEVVLWDESNHGSFDNILKMVRSRAVAMANRFIMRLEGDDILKSIEDRLNAPREMLVLTPGNNEEDGPWP